MKKVFEETDIELSNPVVLTAIEGGFSMPIAVGLLSWLEKNGAHIADQGWKSRSYGNLVENGIEVEFESICFTITCSYEHLYFERVSGNKTRFWALCKLFCETTD